MIWRGLAEGLSRLSWMRRVDAAMRAATGSQHENTRRLGKVGPLIFGRSVGGCIALHDTPITFDGLVLGLIVGLMGCRSMT
jgi:hypothetical protein